MSAVVPQRSVSSPAQVLSELVVPTDTSGLSFVNDSFSFLSYLRSYLVSDMNAMLGPTSAIEIWPIRRGGRAILVCLASSALVASAPAEVTALLAGLATDDGASFVMAAHPRGDVWIVANNTEALRSGCQHWLFLCGARQPLPGIAWKVLPSLANADALSASGVFTPAWDSFTIAGNGGFLPRVGAPNIPNQATFAQNWLDWQARSRFSLAFNGGAGDGDEQFTQRDQWFARHDKTRLAWVNPPALRGYQHFVSPFTYPAAYFVTDQICKINYTHHGTPGVAFDAPAVGSTPWVGITVPAYGSSQANQESLSGLTVGALDPDVNADSAADVVQTDYLSFDGVLKAEAVYKWQLWCSRVATYGLGHPNARYVSAEPNDGTDHCQCTSCKNLLRNGPWGAYLTTAQKTQDATPSDLVQHAANFQASYLRHKANGHARTGVGRLAYEQTYAPPSIPIDVDCRVEILPQTAAVYQQLLPSEALAQWATKRVTNPLGAFKLSIEPSQLLGNTNLDRPRLSPRSMLALAKQWLGAGVTSHNSQTSYSSMAVAFGYHAIARWNWNQAEDIEAILTEAFALLGPAATGVRTAFERWWATPYAAPYSQCVINYQEVQQSLGDMVTAQTALSGAPNAAQQARLDQVIAFVLYQRFLLDHKQALRTFQTTPSLANEAAFWAAADALQSWAWNIGTMCVIHADRVSQSIRLREILPGVTGGDITSWAGDFGGNLLTTTGAASVNALRIEITTAGTNTTAGFRWSTDAGATWTSGVTALVGGNALAGTGVTLHWPAGITFTTNYRMAFNFALAAKWDQTVPGSGFAGVAEPSSGAIATALAAAVTAYPALSGIAGRDTYSETLVRYTTSVDATLVPTPQASAPSTFIFIKGIGDIAATFTASGTNSPATGVPCRILVRDLVGNILQTITPSPAAYGSIVVSNITITGMPAGTYELDVIETGPAGEYSWVSFPKSVPFVQVTGTFPFLIATDFDQTKHVYFYVPAGRTAIALAYHSSQPIQFYDDTGASVATTSRYQMSSATVASGRSGKVWSFSGIQGVNNDAFPYGVNFPSVFAYSAEQMMVPHGLDGF